MRFVECWTGPPRIRKREAQKATKRSAARPAIYPILTTWAISIKT